jgi:DNA-binding transcriptional ArsR family regulator
MTASKDSGTAFNVSLTKTGLQYRLVCMKLPEVIERPMKTAVDRVIHEPARLLIVALLSEAKEADFLFLQRETKLTKGNLSSHLIKLEEAEYVEIEKTFRGKIPRTLVRLTAKGRVAFQGYRKTMNGLLK